FAEAEISDIELSALLVDRAFAGSRENGQYSLGFGPPGEWRRLADRAEWGLPRAGGDQFHGLRVCLPFWLTADGAGRRRGSSTAAIRRSQPAFGLDCRTPQPPAIMQNKTVTGWPFLAKSLREKLGEVWFWIWPFHFTLCVIES